LTQAAGSLRRAVRTSVEILGTGSGLARIARGRLADHTAILAYHNVVAPQDAGRGDVSLHLPLPEFIRQIDRLMQTHEIVDLDNAAAQKSRGRPRAVITFDDAYRGAVTLALPELQKRGLPAVVFVAPGLLGCRHTWWDALGEAGFLEGSRDAALREKAGRTDRVLEAFLDRPVPELPESYAIATQDELERSCTGNIRVGSHTWGHEFLPALTRAELNETLERTRDWLSRFAGPRSSWIALPYGGGSSETARIALSCGHAGVLGIRGGLWRHGEDLAVVPRINVPAGMSSRGVELRTSGVFRF